MYKWVVGHHLVVTANEVLKEAMKLLLKNKKLDDGDLHWKRFAAGRVTDCTVMGRMMDYEAIRNSPYRGIVDRRYLPVSLLKRPIDHDKFESLIAKRWGRRVPAHQLRAKLFIFFRAIRSHPYVQMHGTDVRVFAVPVARSPYRPLRDPVWICSDRSTDLAELSAHSDYFSVVNREWETFASYFISYAVQGRQRKLAMAMRHEVEDEIVAKVVAS